MYVPRAPHCPRRVATPASNRQRGRSLSRPAPGATCWPTVYVRVFWTARPM